jgi:hypothetical protein
MDAAANIRMVLMEELLFERTTAGGNKAALSAARDK